MDIEQEHGDQLSATNESKGKESELETDGSVEVEENKTMEEKKKTEENLSPQDKFRGLTVEGEWNDVIDMCKKDIAFCMMKINESRGTALHVAVNEGKEDVVRSLVDAITLNHKDKKALELGNEIGDTPLHLAATRGFKNICECIIGENGERKELITIDNNEGETPLFQAALSWQKQTFIYLSSLMPVESINYYKDLIRENGDSILHCAIRREFFDLALIIMHKYPKLHDLHNKDGFNPLKLLATRPTAFNSGSKLTWWNRILYHCIHVEALDVEKAVEQCMKVDETQQGKQYPQNYDTCYNLFRLLFQDPFHQMFQQIKLLPKGFRDFNHKILASSGNVRMDQGVSSTQKSQQCQISMPELSGHESVPQNYFTCLQFLKLAYIYILGLSGVGVENIAKMKQKHKWSGQLLRVFMENPYESYMGSGGPPPREGGGQTDFIFAYDPNRSNVESEGQSQDTNDKKDSTSAVKKVNIGRDETVILVAARNGIVEMVNEILDKIPSAIHETNSDKKNVLLVAVENRQSLVVEALKNQFWEGKTKLVLDNLIIGVDKEENTVLHLAAGETDKGWMISGAALQLMWHIKWFQYIKTLVPEHFTVRTNKEEKTAGEIFKQSHKELAKSGSEWLKDTSESCSVVAALLAGVSFATSSTVPGGVNTETGKPALEEKPAFEAFAMASLIGLCFSATALIMFLSILTSRKEIKDFRRDLPLKMLFGLSSLFISIAAMFTSFCSGHFFVIDDKYKQILILIYAVTCLPVSFYAVAQFPLYLDLLKGIATKVPRASDKGDDL